MKHIELKDGNAILVHTPYGDICLDASHFNYMDVKYWCKDDVKFLGTFTYKAEDSQ